MSDTRLKSFIDRVLRLKEEQDTLAADIREVYAEAKGEGYDKTAMGALVSHLRKVEKAGADAVNEAETVFSVYLDAYQRATGTVIATRPHTHEQFDTETGEIILPDPHTPQADGGRPDTSFTVVGAKNDGLDIAIVGQGGASPEIPHGQVEHQPASAAQDGNPVVSASGASATNSDDFDPERLSFLNKPAKPLRPHCQNPSVCAGYGTKHCHACTVAQSEAA